VDEGQSFSIGKEALAPGCSPATALGSRGGEIGGCGFEGTPWPPPFSLGALPWGAAVSPASFPVAGVGTFHYCATNHLATECRQCLMIFLLTLLGSGSYLLVLWPRGNLLETFICKSF
jgi:hypothetical protein